MLDSLIGYQLGQYQIETKIGQGGMASVYKAYQTSISRYVAIKILSEEFSKDANFVKRFEGEAKAVAALEHPHILPVYDFGSQSDMLYMVMRYIEGGTLADLIFEGPGLSYAQVAKIIGDMAGALDYAHTKGIIHRDVKPSNMLIDQFGEVLLTDFGLAKVIQTSPVSRITEVGTVVGTATYMSPEQAADENLDGRTDVYSLGVILFELLTGRPPFQADTMVAVALKHVNEPVPSLREINPNIPESFEQVVFKAMEKWPDDRYQNANDLSAAFNKALQAETGQMVAASPIASPQVQTGQLPHESTETGPKNTHQAPTAESEKAPDADKPERELNKPWLWAALGSLITLVVVIGLLVWFFMGSDQSSSLVSFLPKDAAIVKNLGQLENSYPRTNYARQSFDGGVMLWWDYPQGISQIFVINQDEETEEDRGTDWSRYKNTWELGEPEFTPNCPEATEPNGPIKGFGKLWCTNPAVKEPMGMPLEPEFGGNAANDAYVELYTNGAVFSIPVDNIILVLTWDGRWQVFDAQLNMQE